MSTKNAERFFGFACVNVADHLNKDWATNLTGLEKYREQRWETCHRIPRLRSVALANPAGERGIASLFLNGRFMNLPLQAMNAASGFL